MTSLKAVIKATLSYAAYFHFPLTLNELHHWLITPKPVTVAALKKNLSPALLKKLNQPSGLRKTRLMLTRQKLSNAQGVLNLLQKIPSINLVALTGSLAMENAKPHDDVDLLIVTSPHTLWLTRPLVLFFLLLFFKRRLPKIPHQPNTICTNLWLDTTALKVPTYKHNLYIAHEVLQVKPLYDKNFTYQRFIRANSWTSQYLANAYHVTLQSFSSKMNYQSDKGRTLFLLKALNYLAFKLQYLYMKSKITNERITLHEAYFHPRDLSTQINQTLN